MLRFSDVPLVVKVALSPLIGIVALVGVAVMAVVASNQQEDRITVLNDQVFAQVQQGLGLKDAIGLFHSHLFALMSASVNETDADLRARKVAALNAEMASLAKGVETAMAADLAAQAAPDLPKVFKAYGDAAQMAIDIGSTDATYGVIMMGEADNQFWKLRAVLDTLSKAQDERRATMVAELRRQGRDAGTRAAGLAALVSLVVIAAAVLITRQIVQPLSRLTGAMTLLAGGDLSAQVPDAERGDEVGAMARTLATFKDSMVTARRLEDEQKRETARQLAHAEQVDHHLEAFQRQLQEMVDQLAAAAEDLRGTAQTMSSAAETSSSASESAAGSSEMTSAAVETVAAATEELSSSIAEVSQQVRTSSDVVRRATEDVAKTDQTVQALQSAVGQIGAMVSMIFTIAHQTDLLALNATIEAARAGDAGKGFAVVAAEVKALAHQTSNVTKSVTDQIEAIQAATRGAVGAIHDIGKTIVEVNAITSAVSAAAEQQAATTAEISRSAQSAAHGTIEVSAHMASLRAGTQDTAAAAAQVRQAAERLHGQSDSMRQAVAAFVAGLRAL